MEQNAFYHATVGLQIEKAEELKNINLKKVYGFVDRLTDDIINNDKLIQTLFLNSDGRSQLEGMKFREDLNKHPQFRVELYGEGGVLADKGDIIITVSASGGTDIVNSAMEEVKGREITQLLLTTTEKSRASELADYSLVIPGESTEEEELKHFRKYGINIIPKKGERFLALLGTVPELNEGLALMGIYSEVKERLNGNDDKKCKAFFNEIDYFLKNAEEIYKIDDDELDKLIFYLGYRSGYLRGLGEGKSKLVNKSFMMRLSHLGFNTGFWDDVGSKRLMRGDALVITSGSLPEQYLKIAKGAIENNGVDIFAFTADAKSEIFQLLKDRDGSYALLIPVIPDEVNYSEERPIHIQPFKEDKLFKPRKAVFEFNLEIISNGIIAEIASRIGITQKYMKVQHRD